MQLSKESSLGKPTKDHNSQSKIAKYKMGIAHFEENQFVKKPKKGFLKLAHITLLKIFGFGPINFSKSLCQKPKD